MKVNSLDNTTAANLGKDLAKSLRPQMALLSWIIYSCVIIVHNGLDISSISLGLLLFITMYGIVAIQNDLSDRDTDKLNQRKDIPYAAGRLTELQLIRTMLILSVITTFTGFLLGYQVLPWIGFYILLGFLYSGPTNIKSHGIYAALLLGFCYGAIPWLIAASVTEQLNSVELLLIAGISFIFSSGIIVIKDFKDVVGDKATNKRTILVAKGPAYTRYYYLVTTSVAYVLLIIYSFMINNNPIFGLLAIATSILNYWLLANKSLPVSSVARATRGKWARALFFISILIVYSANISINS